MHNHIKQLWDCTFTHSILLTGNLFYAPQSISYLYTGKKALAQIKADGPTHKLAGIRMGGKPIEWYNADFYHVFDQNKKELIGYVTSAWYSPAQECNIAMCMLPVGYTEIGTKLGVALPNRYKEQDVDDAEVCKTPFKQPHKGNEGRGLNLTGSKL